MIVRARVTPRALVLEPGAGPHLSPETLERARALRPGADVHALAAQWRGWWASSGRKRLRDADKALRDARAAQRELESGGAEMNKLPVWIDFVDKAITSMESSRPPAAFASSRKASRASA